MSPQVASSIAYDLMYQHGLISKGWIFKFDSAKHRFGQCSHHEKIISLSEILVELNEESKVRDVILHEIAHALVDAKHGHDRVWKAKCIEIGADPVRCFNQYDLNVVTPILRYNAVCKCGRKWGRQRKLHENNMYKYSCTCNEPIVWIENKK